MDTVKKYDCSKIQIKGYGRYMDDCYLIHEDMDYLEYCRKMIEIKSEELGLSLNARTRICTLEGSFEYLKKRFTITNTGKVVVKLSRSNITRRRRTIKKMLRNGVSKEDAETSYTCWRGYAGHYDTYHTVRNMDKLLMNSSHGKEQNVRQQGQSRNHEND